MNPFSKDYKPVLDTKEVVKESRVSKKRSEQRSKTIAEGKASYGTKKDRK